MREREILERGEKNSGGCSFGTEKEKEENARAFTLSEKRERKKGGSKFDFQRRVSLRTISLFSVVAAVVVVVRALSSARARRKEAPLPPSLGF